MDQRDLAAGGFFSSPTSVKSVFGKTVLGKTVFGKTVFGQGRRGAKMGRWIYALKNSNETLIF